MTIDQDRNNRGFNFTVPQNQPAGMRIPEYVFAQLLGFILQNIRETVDTNPLIDELFAFTSTEVIKQIKTYLRERKNIFCSVNWPREDVHFPFITCINQGEEEDEGNTFLGDATGVQDLGHDTIGRAIVRRSKAVPMRHVTNVYIASDDAELTYYLYNLVRFIFLSNKMELEAFYDVHNLTIAGQTLEYDETKHPKQGFYRVVQLRYSTMFDWNLSEEASKIVSLELLVDTGLQVPSTVPSTP